VARSTTAVGGSSVVWPATAGREGTLRKLLFLLLPVALLALSTTTASATGKPQRLYGPLPQPLVNSGSCAFDIDVKVVRNNEYVTSFYDANGNLARQLVNGALVVTLTNLQNGRAITVNISGPGYLTFNADGSILERLEGNSAVFFPGSFWLTSGRVDEKILPDGTAVLLRSSGNRQDVCAMLA
jgi:hypothetical protein